MPFGPPVKRLPVDQDDADDLAEAERDDGEIVAAQPQHREAEENAERRREQSGERQATPRKTSPNTRESNA